MLYFQIVTIHVFDVKKYKKSIKMAHDFTLEMANYNNLNNHEKNLFYINRIGKSLKEVSHNTKTKFMFVSFCVYLYLKATQIEQEILWEMYDPLAQYYSDPDKFENSELNRNHKLKLSKDP